MKQYKIYIYALLTLAATHFTACKKILEKPPLTVITADNYFKDGDDAESGIVACYDAMQDDGYYGSVFNIIGEMPSDDATSDNTDVFTLDKIQWTSLTSQPGRFFLNAYKGINRANAVLKYVPGITKGLTEERRTQILGEAHFLRALHHFNLVKSFGDITIRTEPSETQSQSAKARSPQAEVYALIESDLTAAESMLPETFGGQSIDRARATKGAANALQAKVFLYERKWQDCLTAAGKVIANSNYGTTLTPYPDLFPYKNKKESILEVQFDGVNDPGLSLPDLILPNPPATYSFPKYNIPDNDLISKVDMVNDERWKKRGAVEGGTNYTSVILGSGTGNDSGWFVYKWRNTNFFASEDNYPLLTLNDVYLMYAEASNELNGPTPDGLGKLNVIRKRAYGAEAVFPDLPTKNLFRDEVDLQRRFEMAFQGDRWFDLVRYARQTQADPSAVHTVDALKIIKVQRGTADPNYLLYPIPLDELTANPLSKQNPGF
ncbi:MAG: RagB/SusD family nutrient uptake outer membrane protein [Bacteroidota bacterium]